MWRTSSLEKTLILGKILRRGQQSIRWLTGITISVDMILSNSGRWRTGKSGMLQSMGSQRVRHDWATEQVTACRKTWVKFQVCPGARNMVEGWILASWNRSWRKVCTVVQRTEWTHWFAQSSSPSRPRRWCSQEQNIIAAVASLDMRLLTPQTAFF